jgi:hypothetical protein
VKLVYFFQNTNSAHLCKRKILLHHQTLTLLRHAGLWIYFYPERHQVTFRCPNTNNQAPRTTQLIGAGLKQGLSKCYISSTHLPTQPELYGLLKIKPDVTSFYLHGTLFHRWPWNPLAGRCHSSRHYENRRHNLATRSPQTTLDLDSVLIMHQSSSQKEQRTHRLMVIATSIITAVILTIICYLLYSNVRKLQCYPIAAASSPNTSPTDPYSNHWMHSTRYRWRK